MKKVYGNRFRLVLICKNISIAQIQIARKSPECLSLGRPMSQTRIKAQLRLVNGIRKYALTY